MGIALGMSVMLNIVLVAVIYIALRQADKDVGND